jgi:peptidoglycan hydrolase-like protein with peptidoglycan-binding domain
MHKLTIAAVAAALGIAWTVLPAGAQDTMKNKAERAGDKIEDKAERVKDKADAKAETMGEKLDRAVDKTKAKTREMKDKVSNKLDRGDTKNAQQALQAKGYNPGPIDGVHGPRTSAAIRDFQKAEGLTVTGQIDGETRARLMAQSSAPAPAASPATSTPPAPSQAGSPSAPPAAPDKMEKK